MNRKWGDRAQKRTDIVGLKWFTWNGQTGVCEKNVGAPQCQRHSCRPPIPPQINVTKLCCRVKTPLVGIRRLFFFWTLTLFPDRPCNTELGGEGGAGNISLGFCHADVFFANTGMALFLSAVWTLAISWWNNLRYSDFTGTPRSTYYFIWHNNSTRPQQWWF